MIGGQPSNLLGRHVSHRAHHGARLRVAGDRRRAGLFPRGGPPDVLRQAEIEDLYVAVPGDEEILGLQVPVDDAPLMGGPETLRDLLRVVRGLPLGDWTRFQHLAQRLPLQKLHDGEGDAILVPEIEDREDVGMGQRRDRVRLALEARKELRISRHVPGQHFHRHVPLELGVPRPVHLAHSARAERRENLVAPQPPARRQSRRVPSRFLEDRGRGLQRRSRQKGIRRVRVDQQRLRSPPHLVILAGFRQKRGSVGCGNGERPRQDAFHALPFLSVHEA